MKSTIESIGIGHCAVDFLGVTSHYPPLDARVRLEKLYRLGGGEASTAMVTLARLGVSVGFVGKTGDDELGDMIRKGLEQERVDISRVVVQPGGGSLWAFGAVEKASGKRTLFWHKEMSLLTPAELDREFLLRARILHCDQHEPEAALAAAEWFREVGKPVVLDIDELNPRLEGLLRLSSVVIGSEVFAHCFIDTDNYLEAARRVAGYGPETVVFTLGTRGCFCWSGGEHFIQQTFSVPVVDTTGCGDVFHGAYIYGLLQGWGPPKTAMFANAVAAMKCTGIGGRTAIPSLPIALEFLNDRTSGAFNSMS